ncbi:MAG: DUF928 domain-containing protein, partial [Planctomycetota bacterium]|nr:DUF928 domain-containing protein [Planctomycetota bacterium]
MISRNPSSLPSTLRGPTGNPEGRTSKHLFISLIIILCIIPLFVIITKGCFKRESKTESDSSSRLPPGAFTLLYPPDGDVSYINPYRSPTVPSVFFQWSGSSNVTGYLLEISKDDAFIPSNIVYSQTVGSDIKEHTSSWGILQWNKWYYWRVTARNAGGGTVASNAPFSFGTDPVSSPVAGDFNLAEPLNLPVGGEVSASSPPAESSTPTFVWTNAANETGYIVYLDNDNTFATPLYTTTTKPGVLRITIPESISLTNNTRYYWKVVATNPMGNSNSSIYSFVTGPIKYYTLTTQVSTLNAGSGLTATLTAYDNNNEMVITHTPFTITMEQGDGLSFYTSNSFGVSNTARTYTLTQGMAKIYLTAIRSGMNTLTATDTALRSTSTTFTVNPGTIEALTLSGLDTLTSGQESTYSAVSLDNYGNSVSDTYEWSHTNGTGSATLNLNKLTGLLSGTVTITVTSVTNPAKTASKVVTVIPGSLAVVIVSGQDTITSGIQSTSYTAVSKDAAGNLLSDTYTWSHTSGTGSATRSTDKLTGWLAGDVTITATSGLNGTAGNKTVTVLPGAVASVTVSGTAEITSGQESSSYQAESKDMAGNIVTADTYTWSYSSGTGSATLNIDKLTGVLSGTVTITARSVLAPTRTASKTVLVIPGSIATITLSGADTITSAGSSATYTATSQDINGNLIAETYTWTYTDDTGSVTRTDNTLMGYIAGQVTITATGSTSGIAKAKGKVVTVLPGAATTVAVSGASTITSGGTAETYTATSYDVNGNIVSDSHNWTWTTNDT